MPDKTSKPLVQLPKDALSKVQLGDLFSERDHILFRPEVFVPTSALSHALDPKSAKCFYVGRRGTGKTAITLYVASKFKKNTILIHPQLLVPESVEIEPERLRDVHQKEFRTLTSCYKRAIVLEVMDDLIKNHILSFDTMPASLRKARNEIEQMDFDSRLLIEMEDAFEALQTKQERVWIRHMNGTKEIVSKLASLIDLPSRRTIIIDKIDDTWDGSEKSVAFLAGLMHACVELSGIGGFVRPLLFLRENIFDRVRKFDVEFSRLQSSVVSMDWSKELLLELMERRLNSPSNQKLPLGGPTWDHFFESVDGQRSVDFVFKYCQDRPRDILAFCATAIESAQFHSRQKVSVEDLQGARKIFSESRLKELGDEYSENYPQLQIVLEKFYGLGRRYTTNGIADFIKKLLIAEDVKTFCGSWIFQYTSPERFVQLLYSIGFVGVGEPDQPVFRPLGASAVTPPPLTATSQIVIHSGYADALSLHNHIIATIDEETQLKSHGIDHDKPEHLSLHEYISKLTALEEELKTLPLGKENDPVGTPADVKFEEIVGEVIKLSFFRSLTNVAPKERNMSGRIIRDWMSSNTASSGFWEMVRLRYLATEIPWECKNYEKLSPGDFLQAGSYMTQEAGRFSVLVFRGEIAKHYYEHIKRVGADKGGGIILLLTVRDLQVFIRQAKASKSREEHIQERYSQIVRNIS